MEQYWKQTLKQFEKIPAVVLQLVDGSFAVGEITEIKEAVFTVTRPDGSVRVLSLDAVRACQPAERMP